ncbi:MAG: DegT/DnrJ/EryC1/StrS family aminotransferase [Phocaeicola sp.]
MFLPLDKYLIGNLTSSYSIETRPLWKPLHLQPVFGKVPKYVNGVSERLFDSGLCLPSGSALTEEDLLRVCAVVK